MFPDDLVISTADIDDQNEPEADEEQSEKVALWTQVKELFSAKYRWNFFMLVLSKSYTYFVWFMNLYQIQKL